MSALWNVLLVVALSLASTRSMTVKNGAYYNIVVEIQKDVPADDCFGFLLSLENELKLSSEYIHSSLDGRMSYGSFDIILPSAWPNSCANRTSVANYNGAPSDITITPTNEIFGDEPWTQQSGGCEEAGDQIFVGYKSIRDGNVSEKFVTEFLKYRYGVFDVNGFENDLLYPPCGKSGGDRYPTCNDALKVEKNPQQAGQLAQPYQYNRYVPSKQNHLCDRRAPITIINSHSDFNSTERSERFVEPTFKYVKKTLTRYMVIVDDIVEMNVRDSYTFLRDAMRKWLEKDLDHKHTEVGIWLMGNATRSEDVERNLIKPLYAGDDREEILSILPWYIEHRSGPKCMLTHAVTKTVDLMKERARTHGNANSVILVIAPGMFKCSEEQTNDMIDYVNDANMKVTTINYPIINQQNRIAMDHVAYKTGGTPFTIAERKQSTDKSLLTTFFELTSTLMHISALYNDADVSPMPVEIYRKELIDSGSREENKPTSDSFNVDESTNFINFFVYIYDRKERNIEKGMKLVSPGKHEFTTLSDLRSEYHQISIIGNLTGYGSWSYNIKRFYGNPQPHFVQVLAYPKPDNRNFIRTKAFIRRSRNGGPHVLYAQVMKGSLPIIDALVEVQITRNGQKLTATKQLFDNGSGDPDITRGDGIYSRYFAVNEPGMYTFEVFVSDKGNTAYVKKRSYSDEDTPISGCCGSIIPISSTHTVTPFQRYLTPLTIFVDAEDIQQELTVMPFIGRIGDLRWTQSTDDPKITLEWTGVDVGRDNEQVSYEIRYASHLKDILDDFETLSNKWTVVDTIPHNIGQVASVTLNLTEEPTLINQPFYIAIKSVAKGNAVGPVSNIIRVFVPKKRPTPSPHYNNDSGNSDGFEMDPSIEPSFDNAEGGISNTKIAGLNLDVFIAIILCSLAAIILISIYCWCCIIRTRNFQKTKKSPAKSETKQQPAISVIVPQSQQNQYNIEPMNGSMYYADVPDHHTVGLPIDDDMMKPEYLDHDKMLFEEIKHHRQFQQHNMIDPYDQDVSIVNGTLTRNGRYLSPFESWTASQLLLEHERINQRSPLDVNDPSIMYVDANGEMVPPIPPHPYQNNYSSTPVEESRYPPPQYSSVYRPHMNGGSMQSVCNAEKKVRNVTMV